MELIVNRNESRRSYRRLLEAIQSFNRPLSVYDNRLYRALMIRCGRDLYFGFLIHHILADGASFSMLLSNLYALCTDESFVPPRDWYYRIIKGLEDARDKEGFREAERYFDASIRPVREKKSIGLKKDHESRKRSSAIYSDPECFERKGFYDTNFFLTAALVALAWYNECDYAYMYSTYNGRHNRETLTAPGFLIAQLVIGLNVRVDSKPRELHRSFRNSVRSFTTEESIKRHCAYYRFAIEKSLGAIKDGTLDSMIRERQKSKRGMVLTSYLGTLRTGAYGDRIRMTVFHVMPVRGITVQMAMVGNCFYADWYQGFSDEAYVRAFTEIARALFAKGGYDGIFLATEDARVFETFMASELREKIFYVEQNRIEYDPTDTSKQFLADIYKEEKGRDGYAENLRYLSIIYILSRGAALLSTTLCGAAKMAWGFSESGFEYMDVPGISV